jgi:hypothetical protein
MACKELQRALLDGLKVACGAFSERTWEGLGARGQKAWFLPANSGPVVR